MSRGILSCEQSMNYVKATYITRKAVYKNINSFSLLCLLLSLYKMAILPMPLLIII